MKFKFSWKALLYPHPLIMLLLVPFAAVLLIGSMVFVGTESVIAYISYVLAAYTLTVWCFRIPYFVKRFKAFKKHNKFIRRWESDTRLRVNASLYASLASNALFGLFQVWLGFYHRTFWFYSLGAYYICLGAMRFFLLSHTKRYAPGERIRLELKKYRACGWIFLLMNAALSVIVFFMVYWGRTFTHHMITAIAMAAYTFAAFISAVVSIIRYKKYNSPVFSACKAISLAAACVSVLTLTSTLLTAFDDGTMGPFGQKLMLGSVGFAVLAFVVFMAIHMIVTGTKKLKKEVQNGK